MAETSKTFNRWINDPLFAPVKKFLDKRLSIVNEQGDLVDRNLARDRYVNMVGGEFAIESVDTTPDGTQRVCITNRAKEFARVDLEIDHTTFDQVIKDFKVPAVQVLNKADFITKFKRQEVQGKLMYLTWRNMYGVCLSNAEAMDIKKINELTGDIFFAKMEYTRESETFIDSVTLQSGLCTVEDSIMTDIGHVGVFITENIIEELGLNKIQHNFPPTISAKRGTTWNHVMTLTMSDDDVTAMTNLVYTLKNNNVVVTRSDDKLSTIIYFIKGSPTQTLTDELTIEMSAMYGGVLTTNKAVIQITITPDDASLLELYNYPTLVDVPDGMKMAIHVKARFKGTNVTPTKLPSMLTSMLYGIQLDNKGPYRGGWLYLGLVNKDIDPAKVYEDLVSGGFEYNDNGTLHKSNVWVETNIVEPRTQWTGLDLVNLTPTTLKSELNKAGMFNYQVSCEGNNVDPKLLDMHTGAIGPKGLISVPAYPAADTTNYIFTTLKDSGEPGQTIYDTIIYSGAYVGPNGLYFERKDLLFVEIMKRSTWEVVDYNPANIIPMEKYQTNSLPFAVKVNGRYIPSFGMYMEEPTNQIRRPIAGNLAQSQILQVLAVNPGGGVVEASFNLDIPIDGSYERTTVKQKYQLAPYTGPGITWYPTEVSIDNTSGSSGSVISALYNQDKSAGTSPAGDSSRTTVIDGFKLDGVLAGASSRVKYTLSGPGNTGLCLIAVKTGTVPPAGEEDIAILRINTNIRPDDNLRFAIPGAVNNFAYEPSTFELQITYLSQTLLLTDPRLTIRMVAVGQPQGLLDYEGVTATNVNFRSNIDVSMQRTSTMEANLLVDFERAPGDVVHHVKSLLVTTTRKYISATSMELVNPVKIDPNTTDLPIDVRLLDQDGLPILGATMKAIQFAGGVITHPTVDNYRYTMVELDRKLKPGVYRYVISTSNYGGFVKMVANFMIGGRSIAFDNLSAWLVDPQPLIITSTNTVNSIAGAKSTVRFKVQQTRKTGIAPIISKVPKVVTYDNTRIIAMDNLKLLDDQGNYSVEITAKGLVGKGWIDLSLPAQEGVYKENFEWKGRVEFDFVVA